MSTSRRPKPPYEDDRALARMLGCAFLFGVAVLGVLAWAYWRFLN